MITLDEVLGFSTKVPGPYSKLELTKLSELAVALPDNATVVEIGVLYGRAASVFFHVAQHKPLELHFIDPWVVNGKDAHRYFHQMVNERFLAVPFTMHSMTSIRAADACLQPSLIHIDGDHSPYGIQADCAELIECDDDLGQPLTAVFHDYDTRNEDGTLMYPQIKETVDSCCRGWEPLGVHDSQAKFRRK